MLKDLAEYRAENPRLYWRFHKAIAARDREVVGPVLSMGMGRRWVVDTEAYDRYRQARTDAWLRENSPRDTSQSPRSGAFRRTEDAKPPAATGDLR